MKKCNTCFEEIHESARKCVHCSSHQNWKRHVAFGTTFLALVVALISVLSVLIPIVSSEFESDHAVVRFEVLETQEAFASYEPVLYFRLFITNTGHSAAAIRSVLLSTPLKEQPLPLYAKSKVYDAEGLVIPEHSYRSWAFAVHRDSLITDLDRYNIQLHIVDALGKSFTPSHEISLSSLAR